MQILLNIKKAAHEGVTYSCRQCDYQATPKGSFAKHKTVVHERVKYPFIQCNYHITTKKSFDKQKKQFMKESNIPADNMKIKQLIMKLILLTRKWQYMKESNILTGNATIKELERVVLLNRKGQYIND